MSEEAAAPEIFPGMTRWSDKRDKIVPAMVKLHAQVKRAVKNSANPHLKTKYADLADVDEACRQALADNGFAVLQTPFVTDTGKVLVETYLFHESDQYFFSALTLTPIKGDAHGIGSAITYARRYAKAAMCGVVSDDDDGQAAVVTVSAAADEVNERAAPRSTLEVRPAATMTPKMERFMDGMAKFGIYAPQILTRFGAKSLAEIGDDSLAKDGTAWFRELQAQAAKPR